MVWSIRSFHFRKWSLLQPQSTDFNRVTITTRSQKTPSIGRCAYCTDDEVLWRLGLVIIRTLAKGAAKIEWLCMHVPGNTSHLVKELGRVDGGSGPPRSASHLKLKSLTTCTATTSHDPQWQKKSSVTLSQTNLLALTDHGWSGQEKINATSRAVIWSLKSFDTR